MVDHLEVQLPAAGEVKAGFVSDPLWSNEVDFFHPFECSRHIRLFYFINLPRAFDLPFCSVFNFNGLILPQKLVYQSSSECAPFFFLNIFFFFLYFFLYFYFFFLIFF